MQAVHRAHLFLPESCMSDFDAYLDELFYPDSFNGFPVSSHRVMINDRRRIAVIGAAMKEVIRPGDTVIDAGTGTGIFAFLAHRCGAGRVIGLDSSPVVQVARQIKALNFPDAPIEFQRVDLRRGRLPKVRADVIVCELLGEFAVDEGIIPVMRRLRKQILKRQGRLVPHAMELVVAPAESSELGSELRFWDRPHEGIDFSPLREAGYSTVYNFSAARPTLLADPARLDLINLHTVTRLKTMRVSFTAKRAGKLHGIVGWFNAPLSKRVTLSTDPRQKGTHWQQVLFPIGPAQRVARGSRINFSLTMRGDASSGHWRWHGDVTTPGKTHDRVHQFDYTNQA